MEKSKLIDKCSNALHDVTPAYLSSINSPLTFNLHLNYVKLIIDSTGDYELLYFQVCVNCPFSRKPNHILLLLAKFIYSHTHTHRQLEVPGSLLCTRYTGVIDIHCLPLLAGTLSFPALLTQIWTEKLQKMKLRNTLERDSMCSGPVAQKKQGMLKEANYAWLERLLELGSKEGSGKNWRTEEKLNLSGQDLDFDPKNNGEVSNILLYLPNLGKGTSPQTFLTPFYHTALVNIYKLIMWTDLHQRKW